MSKRDKPFVVGEWYHCYNRSLDKRIAFVDARDYQRFLELLYLANDETPLRRGDLGTRTFDEVFQSPRGEPIVSLSAFSVMPGHFHLVLGETVEGGITSFMRKMGTAYTLYFNARYGREGNLFLKPFQSISVSPTLYESAISYVHANPTVLYEPKWRTGHVVDHQFVIEHLLAYPYSSIGAYSGQKAPKNALLDPSVLLGARSTPVEEMLRAAREYSADRLLP